MKNIKKPVMLLILDGYGYNKERKGNAIAQAKTPFFDKLWKEYPHILSNASGELVGLPKGQMGNSEVGHSNIGAGRIMYQSLTLVNKEIKEGNFAKNKVINEAIDKSIKNKSNIHLMGLYSKGGVHSHYDHLFALIDKVVESKVDQNTYLHLFTDGRDVSPKASEEDLNLLIEKIKDTKVKIASISGRYYSMDRDKRWERVQKAYDVIVNRKGNEFTNVIDYILDEHKNNVTDEFIAPAYNSEVNGQVNSKDSIIFFNFRPDRAREISHMFIKSKAFDYKPEGKKIKKIYLATMRPYLDIKSNIIYPIEKIVNTIGEVAFKNNLTQVRTAETEKYPHVTFFIDGGVEEFNFKTESKYLIDSPKVATYDLKPEMSLFEVTDNLIKNIEGKDLLIVNFANPDMVGHTGVMDAVIKSVEVVDKCLEKVYNKFVKEIGGIMFITADHGNADEMLYKDGSPMTKHTTNPVPLIITDKNIIFKEEYTNEKNPQAKLGDYAPTVLKLLNIEKPKEMTGNILIK